MKSHKTINSLTQTHQETHLTLCTWCAAAGVQWVASTASTWTQTLSWDYIYSKGHLETAMKFAKKLLVLAIPTYGLYSDTENHLSI